MSSFNNRTLTRFSNYSLINHVFQTSPEATRHMCDSRPCARSRNVCLSNDQTVPSNIMSVCLLVCLFVFLFFAPPETKQCLQSCLFGYLFCSSLRLNSQGSRDKVPAPRLAPHVSWNNLAWHVLLGAHPLNPVLTHLFIEPSPHPLPKPVTPLHPLAVTISFPLASVLRTQLALCRPCVSWTQCLTGIFPKFFGNFLIFKHPSGQSIGILMSPLKLKSIMFLKFDISNRALQAFMMQRY